MEISIIIPLYKAEKCVEKCLASIVSQTFNDYEVVLVDDASPDRTRQIAEAFLAKHNVSFQSILHSKNMRQSAARNSGIDAAKGRFIMFIDNDDRLSNDGVLEEFYTTMIREKVDIVTANFNLVDAQGLVKASEYDGSSQSIRLDGDMVLKAFLYTRISVSPWSKLIDKNFIKENKLYFRVGMRLEDRIWAFDLCRRAKSCYALSSHNYDYYYSVSTTSVHFNADDRVIKDLLTSIDYVVEYGKSEESEELLDCYYYYVRRMALDIVCFVQHDRKKWCKTYRRVQKKYRKTYLWNYKKMCVLPAWLAYIAFVDSGKMDKFKEDSYYWRLVNALNRYNWKDRNSD